MTATGFARDRRGVTGTGREWSTNEHRCLGCDAHVSADFARVFGNNEDTIYACLNCATLSALRDGQAVDPP